MKTQILTALLIGCVVGLAVSVSATRANYEALVRTRDALTALQLAERLSISIHKAAGRPDSALLQDMELARDEFEQLAGLRLETAATYLELMLVYRPALVFVVVAAIISVLILKFHQQKEHVSRLAESEQALREQNEKLETLMRQRERFIATLAHDLKVPLVGADLVFATLLSGTTNLNEDERRDLLRKLRKNNAEVLTKLQDMIQIYRYENLQVSRPATAIDIKDLLERCADRMAPIAELRGVSIKLDLATGKFACKVDVRGIERLVSSLLDNALKVSPSNSTVALSSAAEGDELQIKVTDHGTGISDADQGRLFTGLPLSRSNNNAYTGNGLGLYLAKLVVDAHGGSIDCASEPGSGSTFTIRLPLT